MRRPRSNRFAARCRRASSARPSARRSSPSSTPPPKTSARPRLREARSPRCGPRRRTGIAPRTPSSGTLADDGELALQEWAARIPPNADTEMLEGLLERQRRLSAELAGQIEEVETELAEILARPADTAIEIAALRRQIDELSTPVQATEGESSLATDARRLRQAGALHRVEAELELLRVEQDTSLDRQRQRELALREMGFQQRLNLRRIEWLQSPDRRAGAQGARAPHRRAREDRGVAHRRAQHRGLGGPRQSHCSATSCSQQSDRLATDRDELSQLEPARDRVATALNDSRTRLELGGASEAVGRWLWSERRRLEPHARLRRRLDDQRRELAELRLRLVTQSDEQARAGGHSGRRPGEARRAAGRSRRRRDDRPRRSGPRTPAAGARRAAGAARARPAAARQDARAERKRPAGTDRDDAGPAPAARSLPALDTEPRPDRLELVRTRARRRVGPDQAVPLDDDHRAHPRGDPGAPVPLDRLPPASAGPRRSRPARARADPRARIDHPPDRRGPHRRHAGDLPLDPHRRAPRSRSARDARHAAPDRGHARALQRFARPGLRRARGPALRSPDAALDRDRAGPRTRPFPLDECPPDRTPLRPAPGRGDRDADVLHHGPRVHPQPRSAQRHPGAHRRRGRLRRARVGVLAFVRRGPALGRSRGRRRALEAAASAPRGAPDRRALRRRAGPRRVRLLRGPGPAVIAREHRHGHRRQPGGRTARPLVPRRRAEARATPTRGAPARGRRARRATRAAASQRKADITLEQVNAQTQQHAARAADRPADRRPRLGLGRCAARRHAARRDRALDVQRDRGGRACRSCSRSA